MGIKQKYQKYKTETDILLFILAISSFIIDHFTFGWLTPFWNIVWNYFKPLWSKALIDWSWDKFILAGLVETSIIWIILTVHIKIIEFKKSIFQNKQILTQGQQKQIPIQQKEQPKPKYVDRYIIYLDVKWHISNDNIEKAIYCPEHEAKMYSRYYRGTGYASHCPIEGCVLYANFRVEDEYDRAVSAIPVMLKKEEEKKKNSA
jgi:hypothetical protein